MKAIECGIYTLVYFEGLSPDQINEIVFWTGGRITDASTVSQLRTRNTKDWMIVHLACGVIFFKPRNPVSKIIACGATARRVARIAEPYGLSEKQVMALYNECSVLTDDAVLDAGICIYESELEESTAQDIIGQGILSFEDLRLVEKALKIAQELYEASL